MSSGVIFVGHAIIVSVPADLGERVTRDGDEVERALLDPDRCGYSEKNVTRLRGSEATADAIRSAVSGLAQLPKNEPVMFFFSGHGYNLRSSDDAGLCVYDPNDPDEIGLLSFDTLAADWGALPAERKLIVLDSCHAGGMPAVKRRVDGDEVAVVERGSIKSFSLGTAGGSVVLSSSTSDQVSNLLYGDETSLFTKYFVNGLKGGGGHDHEGYVTLFDMFAYVRSGVTKECPSQTPILSAKELTENFRLAFCTDTKSRKPRITYVGNVNTPWDALKSLLPILYPLGPTHESIWERAGGDNSAIMLSGSGRGQWHSAIRKLSLGGGGNSITAESLMSEALVDYPGNPDLKRARELC